MARLLRKWADYSARWQKARSKEGLDASKWNRYQKLSPRTQAKTDPVQYAKGVSVNDQVKQRQLEQAAQRQHTLATTKASGNRPVPSIHVIRKRLNTLTTGELRSLNRKSDTAYDRYVTAYNQAAGKAMSPLYYH